MRSLKRRLELPPWQMPSDPVKAVFWFTHWAVKVLARYLWTLILIGMVYEAVLNGFIGGVVTLGIGLSVWAGVFVVLAVLNSVARISQVVSDVQRMQQGFSASDSPFVRNESRGGKRVIESTIVEMEEEPPSPHQRN